MKTEKSVSLGVSEGSKVIAQQSPLQVYGINKMVEGYGSSQGSLIVRTSQVGLVESLKQAIRGKMG